MNLDNDYDNDENNIVLCPICMSNYCPSKEDGKCPEGDMFALEGEIRMLLAENKATDDNSRIANVLEFVEKLIQAERQKRDEMVEAERERFGKILSEIEIGLKNSNGSKLEIEGIIWTAHEAITNHNNPKWYDAKIGM